MKTIRLFVIGISAVALTGCSSYTVKQPASGAVVPAGPVAFRIEWTGGGMTNFTATLDGTNVANQFVIGASNATAMLPVTTAGSHTFVTSADVFDPLYRRDIGRSTTLTFTATAPVGSITLTAPANAQGTRGSTLSVAVSITRSGGTTPAAVMINATGTALTIPASLSLMPSQSSGTLMLTIKSDAPFGVSPVQITASGMGTNSATLSLRVLRSTGAFASANFAVTTGGQIATSPDGVVTLLARTGIQEGLPSAFAAVFRRGTANIGNPIGYNHGATNQPSGAYGGAGFCGASAAGFVIAGGGPGVTIPASAQYAVYFLDFLTARQPPQADVASFRSAYYFQPRVWFSPDCSIAIAAGAHPIGPTNNLAQVLDVARSVALGNFEFDAPSFAASVTTTTNGMQQVTVTADGQARPPIPLP